jgi:hypothetical protein
VEQSPPFLKNISRKTDFVCLKKTKK